MSLFHGHIIKSFIGNNTTNKEINMSTDVITYVPSTQDQAPQDLVSEITNIAKGGIRNVLAYSMALDRLPEEDKAVRRAMLMDHRAKSNIEFLALYAGPQQMRKIPLLTSTGEPVRDSNGDVVMYDEPVEHPYQALINQLNS